MAKDGGKFEGEFKYFLRHGKGTLQSISGVYTGNWVDDKREGQVRTPILVEIDS